MPGSSALKIDRAERQIAELQEYMSLNPVFTCILETNTKEFIRAIYGKPNSEIVDQISVVFGEIVHNLRSALDHAYWVRVSPYAKESQLRRLQFPFSNSKANLINEAKYRLAQKVPGNFLSNLLSIKPYDGVNGNEPLRLLHKLSNLDKHRQMVFVADFSLVSSDMIAKIVPSFPGHFKSLGLTQNYRNIGWRVRNIPPDLGDLHPIKPNIYEREIDLPISVVFEEPHERKLYPLIPTLNNLAKATNEAVKIVYQ